MALTIAAVRMGVDPVGKLPEAAFHCWLDAKLSCPKCDATYSLVCDYAASVGRFFEEESRPLIVLLRKAIFMGHGDGHCVAHFETAGVVVRSVVAPSPSAEAVDAVKGRTLVSAGRRVIL